MNKCKNCKWYKLNKAYRMKWCKALLLWSLFPNECKMYQRKWWKFWIL